jgi:hypothetical protein
MTVMKPRPTTPSTPRIGTLRAARRGGLPLTLRHR